MDPGLDGNLLLAQWPRFGTTYKLFSPEIHVSLCLGGLYAVGLKGASS